MNIFLILLLCRFENTEFLVNDDSIGGCLQTYPNVTIDKKGNFFITWEDYRSTDYDGDIYCKKYSADKTQIGLNFKVNNDEGGLSLQHWGQSKPVIATSESQGFIIVWEDWRNGEPDIFCQLYDKKCNAHKGNVKVNDDAGTKEQRSPKIAMSSSKSIIVWEDYRNGCADVYGQIYDSTNTPIGANFKINKDTSNKNLFPSVAILSEGIFMVVWEDYRNGNADVYGQLYNNGTPIENNFKINTDTTGYQLKPCISSVNNNEFIVVWESENINSNICAQLYDLSGIPCKTNFTIASKGEAPSVAGNNSGYFITVWENNVTGTSLQYKVYYSSGDSCTSELTVTSGTKANSPCIALNDSGNFIITWIDNRENNPDVYYQKFVLPGNVIETQNKVNDDNASPCQDFPAIAMDSMGNSVIVWYDYRNGYIDTYNDPDIYCQKYTSNRVAKGNNIRINDDGTGNPQIFPTLSMNPKGDFVIVWEDKRDGNFNIYGQRGTFNQTNLLSGNFRVSTGIYLNAWPAVAINNSGNFVVFWNNWQGNKIKVFGQKYDSSGIPINGVFETSSKRSFDRMLPAVAMYDSGNFVVAWVDNWQDIYAQLYDKMGKPVGEDFKVNDALTPNECLFLSVATDKGKYSPSYGNFIVVWMDKRNESWDVYGQIFNPVGTPLGNNFRVNNDNISGRDHQNPSIAIDDSGRFIVAWTDFRNQGGDLNVMAQCYEPDGIAIGSNIQINQDMWWGNHQWTWKSIAMGNELIGFAWIDNRGLKSWDVYAKFTDWKNIVVEENDYHQEKMFSMLANPCINKIVIKSVSSGIDNDVNFELYDIAGKFCQTLSPDNKNCGYMTFSVPKIVSGIYFLKIKQLTKNTYVKTLKVVVLK
ncbi:MAG: T9SS type A sorting domain-containing protein [bacterium]|nr:T9SS type A sorting domain-containing protein [bacterium]